MTEITQDDLDFASKVWRSYERKVKTAQRTENHARVIELVDECLAFFQRQDLPYPDDWAGLQRAADDADWALWRAN